MDFFGKQDEAKRDSLILLSVFVTAMLVFGWLISFIASGISNLIHGVFSVLRPAISEFSDLAQELDMPLAPKLPPADPFNFELPIVVVAWLFIAYACFKRWRDISKGGPRTAIAFGAQRHRRKKCPVSLFRMKIPSMHLCSVNKINQP